MDGDPYAVATSIVGDCATPTASAPRARRPAHLATPRRAAPRPIPRPSSTSPSCSASCSRMRAVAAREAVRQRRGGDPARRRPRAALPLLSSARSSSCARRSPIPTPRSARPRWSRSPACTSRTRSTRSRGIYRETSDPRVRAAALQSIGKIQTVEAGEFLVMVLRQETGGLREAA